MCGRSEIRAPSMLRLIHSVRPPGCLLIVRLTYQPEMVTVVTSVFSNSRLHNVVNSRAYQQDRYQQRALITIVDSWPLGSKLGQGMRFFKCNSHSNVK